jgi:hypothetical protein
MLSPEMIRLIAPLFVKFHQHKHMRRSVTMRVRVLRGFHENHVVHCLD